MRVRNMLIGLMVALAVSTAWAGQGGGVRAIDVTGLDLGDVSQDGVEMPVVITSADELYNLLGDDEIAAAINGQIDFSRETLLYFRWVGSGEDRIRVIADRTPEGLEVTFAFSPGLTLDLSPHHNLFAIDNNARWSVGATEASADE